MARKALGAVERGLAAVWHGLAGCLCAPFTSDEADYEVFGTLSSKNKKRYQRRRRSYFKDEAPVASGPLAAAARPTKNPFADDETGEVWEWPPRGHNERLARSGSAPLHVETVVPRSPSNDMPTPFRDWKPPFF